MSQTFNELSGSDTLTASRVTINNNFDAIKTQFSGTSAPFAASATTEGATYYNTSDKKTYRVNKTGNTYSWGLPTENVHTSGSSSISGSIDITTGTLTAATQSASDNSTKVATTAFVKLLVPVSKGGGTKLLYTNTNGVITESTSTVGSSSQPVYLNNGTITAITGAIANNTTGNAATATAAITKSQGDNSTNIATTAYVDTGLNGKQATLVSGTNIKTVNNNSLLGSGNVNIDSLPSQTGQNGKFLTTNGSTASWTTIQQSPDTDGKSITLNLSQELQAIGVINQADTTKALKEWSGTKEDYDLLTPDTATLYNITNDSALTLVETSNLFDFKWSDYLLNDQSWVRGDTFSWQDGTVYSRAYQHLVLDVSNISASTETIGSYTITYYQATDGHKIVLANQETTVVNIYNETGIAWYYILDTVNTRFKLPRTKYGFVGLRSTVGKFVPESLPNITGNLNYIASADGNADPSGVFAAFNPVPRTGYPSWYGAGQDYNFDASRASDAYQNDAPVQQRSTQMYMYFYVGQFNQSATEQTAGLNSELFNGKVDLNLNNMNPSSTSKHTIVGWGLPDYSAGVSITFPYTCLSNGFYVGTTTSDDQGTLYINEIQVVFPGSYVDNSPVCVPVSTGDIITGKQSRRTFYPCVGG